MSDRQKLQKIQQTLDELDKEVADKEVTRDYWDGFCKVFNAVEVVLNENSD
jgi:DNA-binding protein YbaB